MYGLFTCRDGGSERERGQGTGVGRVQRLHRAAVRADLPSLRAHAAPARRKTHAVAAGVRRRGVDGDVGDPAGLLLLMLHVVLWMLWMLLLRVGDGGRRGGLLGAHYLLRDALKEDRSVNSGLFQF